jgi:hypothetical protein
MVAMAAKKASTWICALLLMLTAVANAAAQCPFPNSEPIDGIPHGDVIKCRCKAGFFRVGQQCLPIVGEPPLECMSSATPSCNVYDRCFERLCNCESTADRYFLSYGKRYCQRFLEATNWSAAGRVWRDRTLVCLQEKIVPHLPLQGGSCDCRAVKQIAFRVHVECYTQAASSVCNLGLSDWRSIFDIVDSKDLLDDQDGLRQLLNVARICLGRELHGSIRSIILRVLARLADFDIR